MALRDEFPGYQEFGYRVVEFMERLTVEEAGRVVRLRLRHWQKEPILKVFGQTTADAKRLIKTLFLGLPRGQGKTTLIAALVLVYLFLMGRSQQVFSISANMEQARLIFDFACAMISRDLALSQRLHINRSKCQIKNPANGSIFTALATDSAGAKFGKGATLCICEECQTWDHHAEVLHDALTKSYGKGNADWLTVYIMHPGPRKEGFGKREWDNAVAIRDGIKEDPTYLPVIHAIKPEEMDKWGDEALWRQINPALDDFLSLDLLRQEYKDALTSPEKEWSFKTYRLCAWLDQRLVRWLNVNDYDKCVKKLDLEELKSKLLPGFMAIDGSSKWDLTVAAMCFIDTRDDGTPLYHLYPFIYVPEDNAPIKEIRDKVPYKKWAKEGHIILTSGERQDYPRLQKTVRQQIDDYSIQTVAIDPWQIDVLFQGLESEGYDVKSFGKSPKYWNFPIKELEAAILNRSVVFHDNPCLRWCFMNVSLHHEDDESVRLTKKYATTDRIDAAAASIQAFALALKYVQDNMYAS